MKTYRIINSKDLILSPNDFTSEVTSLPANVFVIVSAGLGKIANIFLPEILSIPSKAGSLIILVTDAESGVKINHGGNDVFFGMVGDTKAIQKAAGTLAGRACELYGFFDQAGLWYVKNFFQDEPQS